MNRLERLKLLKANSVLKAGASPEEIKKFLADIRGEKGDIGEKGEKGLPGRQGVPGVPGRDGKDGLNGKPGIEGKDGSPGRDGIDGKGIRWLGQWETLTNYVVNDAVFDHGSAYICISDHKSKYTTEPNLGPDWHKFWAVLAEKGERGEGGPAGANGSASGGSGTPGGSDTQVQFNDAGSFGGDSGFVYNKTTDTATLGNLVLTNPLPIASGGTGSTTQNFVDLSTSQSSIAGTKTFVDNFTISTASSTGLGIIDTRSSSSSGGAGIVGKLSTDPTASGHRVGFYLVGGLSGNAAGMMGYATEAWGAGRGTELRLATTAIGSTSRTERYRIDENGIIPISNNTYNLGSTSLYWNNLYATRQYLNATAYIDGASAGALNITGTVGIGIVATHTLDVGATANQNTLRINGISTSNIVPVLSFFRSGSAEWAIAGGGVTTSELNISLNPAGYNDSQINTAAILKLTSVGISLGTVAPTHSLTLPSTATGIALYNTSDQTTNYDRVLLRYASNIAELRSENGGTGTARPLRMFFTNAGGNAQLTLDRAGTNGSLVYAASDSGGATQVYIGTTTSNNLNSSSLIQKALVVAPGISQSGTAGYTMLLINPTENATGSGAKLLLDLQVGSVSKFNVDNTGLVTLPTAQGSTTNRAVATDHTQTLTNKRITPRVGTTASSGTPTINTDNVDAYSITAQAAAITSMTTNLSGTPTDFQKLTIRIKDNGSAQSITWGASFESVGATLPTTTVLGKRMTLGFIYDGVALKWGLVALAQEA